MSFRRRIVLLSGLAAAIAVAGVSIVTYVVVRNELRDRVDTELRRDVTETFDVPLLSSSDPPALEIRRSADGGRSELVPASGTGGQGRCAPLSAERTARRAQPLRPTRRRQRASDQAQGPAHRPARGRRGTGGRGRRPQALLLRDRDRRLAPARVHGADRARPCDPGRPAAGRGRRHAEPACAVVLALVSLGGIALAGVLGYFVSRAAVAPGRAPAPRGRAGRDHSRPQPQDRRRGHRRARGAGGELQH